MAVGVEARVPNSSSILGSLLSEHCAARIPGSAGRKGGKGLVAGSHEVMEPYYSYDLIYSSEDRSRRTVMAMDSFA